MVSINNFLIVALIDGGLGVSINNFLIVAIDGGQVVSINNFDCCTY